MSKPTPENTDSDAWTILWGCIAAPLALALLIYAVWPSSADRQHWQEITADLQEPQ